MSASSPRSDRTRSGSGRAVLESILTPTDHLSVSAEGRLQIEGADALELLAQYGSPLFVMSESTLRSTANRVVEAFQSRWPAAVNVMFAIKANNTVAVRRVMSDAGLGGDCFSRGEIFGTVAGGTDLSLVVLNGSNKAPEAIVEAIDHGMVINIDGLEELDLVRSTARSKGVQARVAVRLRLTSADYEATRAAEGNLPDIRHFIDTEQVGSSFEVAKSILENALASEELKVVGYHFHLGRLSREPSYHRWWSAGVADLVRRLREETGMEPDILNIGGGYAREREPEHGASPLMNPHTIEEYAETVTGELLAVFGQEGIKMPALWLEPGRYLAGNAGVLLSTVGAVKTDVGMTWINVDASINDLPRVENAGWDYVALPASQMDAAFEAPADIVGSLCVGRHLKIATQLPNLDRGDTVAFLDVGAYAETASTQYNAVPRPATVLVNGDQSWLIKRRETVEDLYERHLVPIHLDQQPAS